MISHRNEQLEKANETVNIIRSKKIYFLRRGENRRYRFWIRI